MTDVTGTGTPEAQGQTVLVCGGRDYRNRGLVNRTLDRLGPGTVIHGAANGADTLAGEWAKARGVPCTPYPPDRKLDGPGRDWKFRRNKRMLLASQPDLVVAFPGGPGTAHMVRTAKANGFRVITVVERAFERKDQNSPTPTDGLAGWLARQKEKDGP